MIAEVAVRQAVHRAVAQGIEQLGGSGLRDAGSAAACLVERGHGYVRRRAQGGTAGVGEVRRQSVVSQAAQSLEGQEDAGGAGGRQRRAIQVGGQVASIVGDSVADGNGTCRAGEHGRAVIRTKRRADKGPAIQE